jgi:membrane associated rhomboid family serine protease
MFIPVKADFTLRRFPFLTALVCIVCAGVFMKQLNDWAAYEAAMFEFCDAPRSNIKKMIFKEIVGPNNEMSCIEVVYGISESENERETIERIVSEMRPLKGFSAEDSQTYVTDVLFEELRNYRVQVPEHPDDGLAYETASWNPITMLTSTFAHGSWTHIIFNLIFFIAFAATVEIIVGTFTFISAFIVIGLAAGIFSSVSALASGNHFSTVGLSGVVTGMIGLFAYLLPGGKIRCYYWFVIFVGSVAVPAWALALWYIGGDIYKLFAYDDHGIVNVMAHVSGGIAGYLFGLIFLRRLRWEMRMHQIETNRHALMPGN